jgi:hypothetical protein
VVPPASLDPRTGKLGALWILMSSSPAFFSQPAIAERVAHSPPADDDKVLLWTDDHSSILPILH